MDGEIIVLIVVAFGASILTFFSGFGLGTMLTPVFMLFFPLPVAIALTAVVHFLNNVFKFGLIGRSTNLPTLLKFGIPSVIGVLPGVWLLNRLAQLEAFAHFSIFGINVHLQWINVCIGTLMILFSIAEFKKPRSSQPGSLAFATGGFVSGFFGGLSGHQGALRSAFLIRMGLSKEAFIATGISIALFVDITRIPLYYSSWLKNMESGHLLPLIIAVFSAFAGAYAGRRWLKKTSLFAVRKIVGFALIIFGVLLILGIIN